MRPLHGEASGLGLHDSGGYEGGNEFLNCKVQSSLPFQAQIQQCVGEGNVKTWLYLILLTDTPTAGSDLSDSPALP